MNEKAQAREGGLWTEGFGAIGATLKMLQDHGVTLQHLARLRSDSDYAERVANYITQGGYEVTTSQKRAREIMGNNFLGIREVLQHFGICFTKEEMVKLADIPFSERLLQVCKDTHILFVGCPLTIADIREKVPKNLFYLEPKGTSCPKDVWWANEGFVTKEKVSLRWYLTRRDVVPESANKAYQEQRALLGDHEAVPRVCELVYMTILHYLIAEIPLFEYYVRCQDVTSGDHRVHVGIFRRGHLDIGARSDRHHEPIIGIAASVKVPEQTSF